MTLSIIIMFPITMVYHGSNFAKKQMMTWVVLNTLRFHGIGSWTESPAFIHYFCTARLEDVFAHCIPAIASMIAKVERCGKTDQSVLLLEAFPGNLLHSRTLNSHCHAKQMSSTSIHCHFYAQVWSWDWLYCTVRLNKLVDKWTKIIQYPHSWHNSWHPDCPFNGCSTANDVQIKVEDNPYRISCKDRCDSSIPPSIFDM